MKPAVFVSFLVAAWLLAPALASAQVASCPVGPTLDCKRAGVGQLQLRPADANHPFVWTWFDGDATELVEFGDPTSTRSYAVCGYAGTHSDLVFEASVPADSGNWAPIAPAGWIFQNETNPPDGIDLVILGPGEQGEAALTVLGKGANLPALPFGPAFPLRFQLINNETDVCWEDSYDGTDIDVDEAEKLLIAAGPEDSAVPFPVLRAAVPLPALTAVDAGVAAYLGAPAVAKPMPPLVIPPHPFLDNHGDSRIHNDHYSSAVYNRAGPLGVNPSITTTTTIFDGDLGNICAMLAFTQDGYPIGTCIHAALPTGNTRLMMFDPLTLDILADVSLAPRPLSQGPGGGAYFSIRQDGRFLIGPANNAVEIWALEVNGGTPQFVRYSSFDVSHLLPADGLLPDTVVDYQGRLWFVATSGEIGYVDSNTGLVQSSTTGEELQNSLSVDDSGVYVVTSESMQKFSVDFNGAVVQEWRTPYDNSGPGILQPGSGTTPTLFGTLDDLVGVADTAEPQVNMMVYDRTTGSVVCQTPLFRPGESGAENTFLAYEDDIVVVNNSGFSGAFGIQRTLNPGMERHRVRADRSGCDPVWINHDAISNSAQLSTTNGLIYGWAPDPNIPDLDAYYFIGTDWDSGDEVFRVYSGNDQPFNPVTGQMHVGPDGSAYIGAFHGIIRVADNPPGC